MNVTVEEDTIGVPPFLATVIVLVVILLFAPELVLRLPRLAFGGIRRTGACKQPGAFNEADLAMVRTEGPGKHR